jgi:UDP-N-acetylmuramoyl-L-alanyl-D-glutamate--2,6-diaminopimelate ligase
MQPNLKVSIMVDYAHEPESIKSILATVKDWRTRQLFDKVIHIVSSCGTGRDDWKKPVTGSLSYSFADFSVVTTEDYGPEDDPQLIVDTLTKDFPKETEIKATKDWKKDTKFIKEINRTHALELALEIADQMALEYQRSDDICKVLIISTSVGSQQTMTQPEGEIEYDERKVWTKVFGEFTGV